MTRRLAVVLFLLGLLRVLWAESRVEAQYPWSPTKTPTRRPTLVPTRPPVPTATATSAVPTPTPIPPTPTATVPPAQADVTLGIGSCVTSAVSRRLGPAAVVEVRIAGVWRRIVPGPPGACWRTAEGVTADLSLEPFSIRWSLGAAREEIDGRGGPLRILTAERSGSTEILTTHLEPAVVLATRRY